MHAFIVAAMVFLIGSNAASAAAGPVSSSAPTVSGTAQQGKKLTASTGTWAGAGSITYAFQWYRCDASAARCSSIHGATASTYTEVAKDVGHSIGLTVRATDTTGVAAAYAGVTGLVSSAASTLAATAQPALAGGATVGGTLAAQTAAWSATPATTAYAWLRCNANGRACVSIAGQSGATYTLTAGDAGHTVLAVVTAALGKGNATALSLRSGVVRTTPGPVASTPPAVSGTTQQGKQLTATPGAWASGGSIAYAYQWYRCDAFGAHCSSIHGATKATYTVVAKDVGQTIGLTVRATDATGTAAAYAPLVGLVAPASGPLVATAQPKLEGAAAIGSTLKVAPVVWNVASTTTRYAWLRCNANGRACARIASEATASYEPTSADAGHVLVAEATGTSGTIQQTVLSLGALVVS